MRMKLSGYLQLDLCVALGSSMDSSLNAYAVLTVFMQTSQFTNFATTKRRITVTTIVEGLEKQGTWTVKGLTKKLLGHAEASEG